MMCRTSPTPEDSPRYEEYVCVTMVYQAFDSGVYSCDDCRVACEYDTAKRYST